MISFFPDNTKCPSCMHRLVQFCVVRMACNNLRTLCSQSKPLITPSYEETIAALNGLQSNAQTLEKSRRDRSLAQSHVPQMHAYLNKLGITTEDLDHLNSVHVAGTKGKGSTCAFADSVLRCHGLRTGFYSSPHLLEARERIRICGQPLSRQAFTSYFWEVYAQLQKSCDSMPPYFMFLTLMAFYTFLNKKIDVAIIEVGLGGEYDCTNVLRKPVVVGITPIGLDHTTILGDTLPKIAWQKSGIFKNSVPAFTVPQADGVMPVFKERAQQIGCTLQLVPPLQMYRHDKSENVVSLGVPGPIQKINASLAIQLAHTWLKTMETGNGKGAPLTFIASQFFLPPPMAEPFPITDKFARGLRTCFWPGRFQTVRKDEGMTYFLDGAHTEESMVFCSKWFLDASSEHSKTDGEPLRVLIFNCTGDRRAEALLSPLAELPFHAVLFCPNQVLRTKDSASDQSNFMVDPQKELEQCRTNARIWSFLQSIVAEERSDDTTPECHVFECLSEALCWLSETTPRPLHVLATGSLHLVGGVLGIIHPSAIDAPDS